MYSLLDCTFLGNLSHWLSCGHKCGLVVRTLCWSRFTVVLLRQLSITHFIYDKLGSVNNWNIFRYLLVWPTRCHTSQMGSDLQRLWIYNCNWLGPLIKVLLIDKVSWCKYYSLLVQRLFYLQASTQLQILWVFSVDCIKRLFYVTCSQVDCWRTTRLTDTRPKNRFVCIRVIVLS